MLARYKKGGGIIELVKLIEEAGEPKRSQLIKMIKDEDADFAARVEARLFNYEMLKTLPENLLAEIISASPPKMVALALMGEPDQTFVTLIERCVGKNFSEYKAEKEMATSQPPNPGQIEAARKKIIAEARKLEADGTIKLPFSESAETSSAGKLAMPGAPAQGVGTASDEVGCPPIESFGIEAPPPGLTGERLETYLKSQLER